MRLNTVTDWVCATGGGSLHVGIGVIRRSHDFQSDLL